MNSRSQQPIISFLSTRNKAIMTKKNHLNRRRNKRYLKFLCWIIAAILLCSVIFLTA